MDRKLVARGLEQLARHQHGVVDVRQLYELGLSEGWLRTRERAGWLHRVYRGVYAIGRSELSQRGELMAATLAAGIGSALSHRTAAALWQLLPSPPAIEPLHVTTTSKSGRAVPGLVIHRRPSLREIEFAEVDGIRVTAVELTLIDLASVVTRRQLERALDEADRLRLTRIERLSSALKCHRGRRGAGRLRKIMREHELGSTATRSPLEERALALCRRHRLPQPEVNAKLNGFEVDLLWRDAKLVVELDGRGSHGTHGAFQRDRDRDSALAADGYTTLRFTWFDVTRRAGVVAHRIRRVLNRRVTS